MYRRRRRGSVGDSLPSTQDVRIDSCSPCTREIHDNANPNNVPDAGTERKVSARILLE